METKKSERIVVKTLGELGPNLPVGVNVGPNARAHNFKLRPFVFKREREISEAKEALKNATFGEFVTVIMSIMVHSIGAKSFDNMKEGERQLYLSMMNMADVMYMYVWLRYDAMGPDEPVKVAPSCPRCDTTLESDAILSSMEVKIIPDSITDLSYPMILRDGVEVRGSVLRVFKNMPMRWGTAANPEYGSTSGAVREGLIIRESIVKAEGDASEPFVLTEDDLDNVSKFDLETCKRVIEKESPGPKMSLDMSCHKCKLKFKQPINWEYNSFFSRGAQATPG
jgi:hypothetical protein